MLKRLRRKFVLVNVASLALVLLVLVVGINAGMRYFNARSADSLLEDMAWHEGEIPQADPPKHRPWEYPVTEETPFETRYFAVYVDSEGQAEEIKLDFIRAIDAESAVEYTCEALESGKRTGYVSRYRFLAYDGEKGGSIYFFLDCSRQLWTQKVVLLVSCVGSLAVLAATALVLFCALTQGDSPDSSERGAAEALYNRRRARAQDAHNRNHGRGGRAGAGRPRRRVGGVHTALRGRASPSSPPTS